MNKLMAMSETKKIRFDDTIRVKHYNLEDNEKKQKRTTWLLIKLSIEELDISYFCYGKKKINHYLMNI